MRKSKVLLSVVCAVFVLGLVGCAQQPKTENASAAIKQAKELGSVEEQAKFLISEANAFISSEQFDEAIKSAKYVLSNLDKNSAEAKSLIEKAQAELKVYAEKKAAEAKAALEKKMGSLGK